MMTHEEKLKLIYRHTHRDYKGRMNGVRTILTYRNGTCLVALNDLTAEEVATRFAVAEKAEARKKRDAGYEEFRDRYYGERA